MPAATTPSSGGARRVPGARRGRRGPGDAGGLRHCAGVGGGGRGSRTGRAPRSCWRRCSEPGLKIEEVFERVRINVARRSKGAQTPWGSSSLTGDLVVNATGTSRRQPCPRRRRPHPIARACSGCRSRRHRSRRLRGLCQTVSPGAFAALARQRLASVRSADPGTGSPRASTAPGSVTVDAPRTGTPLPTRGGSSREVKDGALAAQLGDVGQPNSLSLGGKIRPDGKAGLEARGMMGDPRNTVNGLSQGAAYAYRVDAVFEDARGSADRAGRCPPV